MDDNSPTQKQRAGRYAGNLGYFRQSHHLRTLRLWLLVIAMLLSIGAVVTYRHWGKDELFSKGALSQGHARLARDCRACHADGQTDALHARLADSRDGRSVPAVVSALFSTNKSDDISAQKQSHVSAAMDKACLSCHPAFGFHLPQPADLRLQTISTQTVTVHADNCFVCHREHVGSARMALPDGSQCISCHGDLSKLIQSRASLPSRNLPLVPTGENRNLGDGIVRFITPSSLHDKPVAFSDFAHGHPAFSYEDAALRDPAALKFNHARHLRPDLSGAGKDRQLTCTDCHAPGPGGTFKQPVTYEQHCQQCHSLQLLPSLPKLRIPHGDAEKVRWFLASVRVPIENALRTEGIASADDLARRADAEMDALRQRGLRTLAELEQRVFYEGDPKDEPNDRRMRAGNAKFLTECAKCHTLGPASVEHAPEITPPRMAMQWLQKGQFTHLPHEHMACIDCHGTALKSKLTSDILLPPQSLCAECHRAPQMPGESHVQPAPDAQTGASLSTAQRARGGVKWDCQTCHAFHSPTASASVDKNRPAPISPAPEKAPRH